MQTRQNSTNIDWGAYEGDGWCPGCDFCRESGVAHEIGLRPPHSRLYGERFDGSKHDLGSPEMAAAVREALRREARLYEWRQNLINRYNLDPTPVIYQERTGAELWREHGERKNQQASRMLAVLEKHGREANPHPPLSREWLAIELARLE